MSGNTWAFFRSVTWLHPPFSDSQPEVSKKNRPAVMDEPPNCWIVPQAAMDDAAVRLGFAANRVPIVNFPTVGMPVALAFPRKLGVEVTSQCSS